MKYNIKNIIIFTAGLLTGAGVSFLFVKNRFDEQLNIEVESLQKELDVRIQEAEEYYKGELKTALVGVYGESKPEPEKVSEDQPDPNRGKNVDYAGISKKASFTHEQKKDIETVLRERHIIPASEKDHPRDDEPEEHEQTEDADLSDGPYTITAEEFFQTNDNYEKISLNYYSGDNVLTDASDGPIPDIEPLVGSHNLTKFGEKSGDANVVYVRNEASKCDLEITLNENTYAEIVLGVPIEPKMKQEKPKAKRIKKSSIDGAD